MFINHTNHPSDQWSEKQRAAALQYGEILDMPFPDVPSELDEEAVREMAEARGKEISALRPEAVLCQGEFTYSYQLIHFLKERGVKVLAATSCRDVREWTEAGVSRKAVTFRFVRFREY